MVVSKSTQCYATNELLMQAALFELLASPQDMGCMGDHGAVPLPDAAS